MARANTIQTNFTSGEISPQMWGRVDVNKYQNGVAKLRNFIVRPQGGVSRRPGTKYMWTSKLGSHVRLQLFIVSTSQTYILEFGDNYVRVYQGAAMLTEIVTPYAQTDVDTLYFAQSADELFIAHPTYAPMVLAKFSDGAWSLTAYMTGGPNAYTGFAMDGPYLDSDVSGNRLTTTLVSDVTTLIAIGAGVDFTGSVGKYVEFMQNGIYYISKILTVLSTTSVSVKVLNNIFQNANDLIDITIDGSGNITSSYSAAFSADNVGQYCRSTTSQTWSLSTALVSVTPTSEMSGTLLTMFAYTYPTATMVLQLDRIIDVTVRATESLFVSTDVGRMVRLQFAEQWRSLLITVVTSATQVSGTFNDYVPFDLVNGSNLYNGGTADNFAMGSWSDTTGYPSVVSFHSQRLCWANSPTQPSTIWMSQSADYYNMAPTEEDGTVVATDALNVTIASGKADGICWMKTGQVLLLGTFGAEYEVVNPSSQTGISPTNIDNYQQSQFGSLPNSQAQRCGIATIFLQRGGNKLREMVYMFQYDSFVAKDISILSEHMLRDRLGAKTIDYQVEIISTFWIVANNGDLVGVTYDRDQDVVAFHPHTISGGIVESVVVAPGLTRDDVYLSVKRTINGAIVRYVEMLQPLFDTLTGDTKNAMNFLDSSLSYSGPAITSIAGLTYLQGQTIQVVANGKQIDSQLAPGTGIVPLTITTVDDTQDPPVSTTTVISATSVAVGLQYCSTLSTLEPDGGSQAGSSQGERKRISEVICRVKDALPFKHGPDEQHLTLIDEGNFGEGGPGDGSLFTGNVRFTFDGAYDTGASVTIKQDAPYPLTILALIAKVNTNE